MYKHMLKESMSSRQPLSLTNIDNLVFTGFYLNVTFYENIGSVVNGVYLFLRQQYYIASKLHCGFP